MSHSGPGLLLRQDTGTHQLQLSGVVEIEGKIAAKQQSEVRDIFTGFGGFQEVSSTRDRFQDHTEGTHRLQSQGNNGIHADDLVKQYNNLILASNFKTRREVKVRLRADLSRKSHHVWLDLTQEDISMEVASNSI
ncbi:hypothetical protein HAX54_043534 [Datura stramonium]|uniref:Uncharacterized protein n=1 Tax=Datura stramonium TaxID=4076 RepID=A0ABS8W152_DATST|nr:hypothetical protein [Datura stramonium]